MSINSLTNKAIVQQVAGTPPAPGAATTANIAAAAEAMPANSLDQNRVRTALDALTQYIPTESVTLYIGAVAITPALISETGYEQIGQWLYWLFALLTPALLLLVLVSKRAAAGESPKPPRLPWWKMIAATIAFLVWALAVPNNPYITTDALAIIAGFGAIFVSLILSLLEPIFERPAASPPQPTP